MPAPGSGILSFGLVAIPVKIHTAIGDQSVSFNLLHNKCGSRLRNRIFCPICNQPVERDDLIRGFEYSKGEYAKLTDDELEALEAEANRSIDLKEFVPVAKVDPIYFESAYYLGPDEGGEKPYRLLADALAKTQRVAVAELVSRGKEQIVIIRPYQGGLVLHGMYYQHEIRDVNQVPRAESERVTPDELKLAQGLLDRMSDGAFEPEKYQDEYRIRVLAMIDEKVKGHKITAAPPPVAKPGPLIDLMEALRQSMKKVPEKKAAASPRKTRKKA
jgi:DNA end-binding protein Ku